jgi:hypothetical protein
MPNGMVNTSILESLPVYRAIFLYFPPMSTFLVDMNVKSAIRCEHPANRPRMKKNPSVITIFLFIVAPLEMVGH